jgi:hypothetical protein
MKIVSQFDAIVEMEYRLVRVWGSKEDSGYKAHCPGGPRIGRRWSAKAETGV